MRDLHKRIITTCMLVSLFELGKIIVYKFTRFITWKTTIEMVIDYKFPTLISDPVLTKLFARNN